jgi:hypothetical protein
MLLGLFFFVTLPAKWVLGAALMMFIAPIMLLGGSIFIPAFEPDAPRSYKPFNLFNVEFYPVHLMSLLLLATTIVIASAGIIHWWDLVLFVSVIAGLHSIIVSIGTQQRDLFFPRLVHVNCDDEDSHNMSFPEVVINYLAAKKQNFCPTITFKE